MSRKSALQTVKKATFKDLTAALLEGHRSPHIYRDTDGPLTVIARGWSPTTGCRGVVIKVQRGNYFIAMTDKHYRRCYLAPETHVTYTSESTARKALRSALGVNELTSTDFPLYGPVPRGRRPKPVDAQGFDCDMTTTQQDYNIFVSTPTGVFVVQS